MGIFNDPPNETRGRFREADPENGINSLLRRRWNGICKEKLLDIVVWVADSQRDRKG
jgi:hypothetical protein